MFSALHSRWIWRTALVALCAVLLHAGAGTTSALHQARLLALGQNDFGSVCLSEGSDGLPGRTPSGSHCALCMASGAAPLPATPLFAVAETPARVVGSTAFASAPPTRETHRADLARAPPLFS